MEARVFPYEGRKPDEGWFEAKQLLGQTTLLLVAQVGPTVFNVRDEQGKCWRVTVGNPHRCTCYAENFCVHVVYVILKVLRVPEANPLAWQRSYTSSDIDQVLSGRARQIERRVATRRSQTPSRSDSRLPAKVQRHKVEEDKICPICQDEFDSPHGVSWCKTGCGNNMHISCMITYAEYKSGSRAKVTCPLCRHDWGSNILHSLQHQLRADRPLVKLAVIRCAVCRKQVRDKFFRCLDCTKADLPFDTAGDNRDRTDASVAATENDKKKSWTPTQPPTDICQSCHSGNRRSACTRNHTFVTSDASASCWNFKWEAIPTVKELSTDEIRDLQSREFSANDYQRLVDLCQRTLPVPLHDCLVGWLLTGDEINGHCCLCAVEPPIIKTSSILVCGHAVHRDCIQQAIVLHHTANSQSMDTLQCPQCNNPLFSALTRRPVRYPKVAMKSEATGLDDSFPVRGVSVGPSRSFSVPSLRETNGRTFHRNRLISSSQAPTVQSRPQCTHSQDSQMAAAVDTTRTERDLVSPWQTLFGAERTNRQRRPPRIITPFRSRTPDARSTAAEPATFEIQGVQLQQQSNNEREP